MPDSKYASIKPYAEKAVSPTVKIVTDGGTNLIRLRELFCHESYRETEAEVHEVVTKDLFFLCCTFLYAVYCQTNSNLPHLLLYD